MRRIAIGWLFLAALHQACGAAAGSEPAAVSPDGDEHTAATPTAVAKQLARSGNHLAASRYWEAALARGAAEREVLPPLIAAEIRAGRLRAALANLQRLEQLLPASAEITELSALLASLLGDDTRSGRPEEPR